MNDDEFTEQPRVPRWHLCGGLRTRYVATADRPADRGAEGTADAESLGMAGQPAAHPATDAKDPADNKKS